MLHCHSFYYYTLLLCRRSSFYYILQPHFGLILLLLVQQSLQDSSQVGGVGVSFACGNSLSSSSSSSSNNNNPSSATLSQYQLIGIDVLIKNVCSPLSNEPTSAYLPGTGYLIARCEECSKCPQELLHLYRALTQLAVNAKLQSLIIVVDKELERLRPQSSRSTPGNTPLVKFIFSTTSDDDGGLLSLCDPSNDANDNESLKSFSKTSVLFVSISFIILIVISLAWLVFYYVQRFRYAHAKDRLQRRLFNAAKRVLAKIPTRPVKSGDIELKSDCPVCIDPYKPGDICRQLPCRHIFHKSCVDPWLLEHRTCPMCKSDILKAFGINVNRSRAAQFSAASVDDDIESNGGRGGNGGVGGREGRGINNLTNNEVDRLSLESTSSDSANPFPVVTEVHDPFGFSPSTSPQFIQTFQNNSVPIKTTIIPKSSSSSLHCEIIQTQIERHEQVEENLNDLIPSTSSSNTNFDENNKNLKKLSKINEKDEEEDEVKNEKLKEEKILNGQKRGKNNNNNNGGSAPLRLFRAVTGRSKNNVNTAIVRLSRSRSLSHHYPTEIEKNTNNGNGQPFIFYSLKGDNLRKIKKDLSFDNNSIQTKSTFLSSSPQSQTETSTSSTSSSSKILPSLTENNDKDKNNSSFRALTAPGDFRRKKGGGGSFNNGERLKTSGGIKILKIKNKNVNNGQNNLKQHSLSDGDLKEDKK